MTRTCDIAAIQNGRPATSSGAPSFETRSHVAVLLFCGAILACAALLTPGEEGLSLVGYRWPFYCWLHETLGIPCALCGMSRSFCALAHGDLSASLRFHRFGPAVFALFCLQIPYRLYALATRPQRVPAKLTRLYIGLAALIGAGLFVNWIITLGGLLL